VISIARRPNQRWPGCHYRRVGSHRLKHEPERPAAASPPRGGDSARNARHAKVAPGAGRSRRRPSAPFYESRRVIVAAAFIAVLIVIGIGLVRWFVSAPGNPCAPDYVGKQSSDVCADAGGTVSLDNFTVSATPLAASDDETGGIALCSSITLTNNSGDKQDYNSQDFKIQDPNGEANPDSPGISGTLRSGALGPGGTKTGTICDGRPARRGLYALVYQPSLFGEQRGVWLSQH
jgi:hypothetical protein